MNAILGQVYIVIKSDRLQYTPEEVVTVAVVYAMVMALP